MTSDCQAAGGGSVADQSCQAMIDRFAANVASPGGGSAAALAAAIAAALVQRCATAAQLDDVAARASALREQLVAIADHDAAALSRLVEAINANEATRGDPTLFSAASAASEVPTLLRDAARQVAGLAESLEVDGTPRLRGEAQCAMLLATAAANAAKAIITLNDGLAEGAYY